MSVLFERKNIDDFSKKVRDVFNLMSITRKYKVIGSGGLKSNKYSADYDLNEMFETSSLANKDEILDKLTALFQKRFQDAEENPDYFITDFKCGMDEEGEPLRWDKDDVRRGYKILQSGRKITMQECLLMKTTLKLDVIALIDGVFTEFSDNYLLKIGDDANFFPHDLERGHLLNSIKHSYDEYFYARRNYIKALKRCFSYYLQDGEDKHLGKLKALQNFFNSQTGLLYKIGSEIDTILLVMENNFRRPKGIDLVKNIKIIRDRLETIDDAKPALRYLNKAKNAYSANEMATNLEKSKKIIDEITNNQAIDFIERNKNVLLY